jgi:hypothetical protein
MRNQALKRFFLLFLTKHYIFAKHFKRKAMKRLVFLLSFLFVVAAYDGIAQSATGGKPKQVINGPVAGGTPTKTAKKVDNYNKKAVNRKPSGMLTTPPPPGAREKRQNKTHNRPKKSLRY